MIAHGKLFCCRKSGRDTSKHLQHEMGLNGAHGTARCVSAQPDLLRQADRFRVDPPGPDQCREEGRC